MFDPLTVDIRVILYLARYPGERSHCPHIGGLAAEEVEMFELERPGTPVKKLYACCSACAAQVEDRFKRKDAN